MRKIVPLVGVGCFFFCCLCLIVAGTIWLGIGVVNYIERQKSSETSGAERAPPFEQKRAESLSQARKNFKTISANNEHKPRGEMLSKAPPDANIVDYDAGEGKLQAYISKPRKDRAKRPAVVWAHDRFEGIGRDDWKRARAFYDAGFVVMVPSFRSENRNAGSFQMFYGEVDDLLAAVDYAADLPDVDRNRIYVAGDGDGGTLALLAATYGTTKTKVRAFFSIAGTPDLENLLRLNNGMGDRNVLPPFNWRAPHEAEAHLRSALPFVSAIDRPTFYFGVISDEVLNNQAMEMERIAIRQKAPFRRFVVAGLNRDAVVEGIIKRICSNIKADAGEKEFTFHIEEPAAP